MTNFHINTINIDGREPYLKIYFEDIVDKDAVSTWLNSQGFLRNVNVDEDEYCKVFAVVYLLPDSNIQEIQERLTTVLQRFES